MEFTIISNERIAPNVWRMALRGDTRNVARPGQFVQVQVPGFFLRRPISVCDWTSGERGELVLVFKVVGHGTAVMGGLTAGATLDLLTGLGNGYDMDAALAAKAPLLIGGGVGTPPIYGLCKRLALAGRRPTVILGFNTAEEIILRDEMLALGAEVRVATADGSEGARGFVTDAMRPLAGQYDFVCACGPEPMLKAVYAESGDVAGLYSFEERMACGFGACMGCSCKTKYGSKRICKDGPVLCKEEIVW